jgi:hypothetical protein
MWLSWYARAGHIENYLDLTYLLFARPRTTIATKIILPALCAIRHAGSRARK